MEQVDPTGCRAGNKFTSRPNLTYTQNKSIARVLKCLPTFLGGAISPYKSAPAGAQLKEDWYCALVLLTKWIFFHRLSETAVWQVRLPEVRRKLVPDSRSSCTEGSVAEVGLRSTNENRRLLRVSADRSLLGRASVTRQQSTVSIAWSAPQTTTPPHKTKMNQQ